MCERVSASVCLRPRTGRRVRRGALSPRPETRDPKLETRNLEPEIRDPTLETRKPKARMSTGPRPQWHHAALHAPFLGGFPLSSAYGTHKTVKARFWPGLSGKTRWLLQAVLWSLSLALSLALLLSLSLRKLKVFPLRSVGIPGLVLILGSSGSQLFRVRPLSEAFRSRAHIAHTRPPRPDSSLGFQVQVF